MDKERNTLIFTISVNCSKITAVMLRSFHAHHPQDVIHVIGTPKDFAELGDIGQYRNTILVDISGNQELMEKFRQGHAGTTQVWAMAIKGHFGAFTHFIHIDSDIYFKKESLGFIEEGFEEGYDIVGSRRCYGNNPSGISGLEIYPDTISTYYFGVNISKIPNYSFEDLCKFCAGGGHPLGWQVLDCFDGVTHAIMENGGKVKYIDWNIIGSQDINGKKNNNFPTNMHMDCGENIIHFGGVGSGYAYFNGFSKPEASYASWAVGRWALFSKMFYGEDIDYHEPTVYGDDGRWINGGYDEKIMDGLRVDIQSHEKVTYLN